MFGILVAALISVAVKIFGGPADRGFARDTVGDGAALHLESREDGWRHGRGGVLAIAGRLLASATLDKLSGRACAVCGVVAASPTAGPSYARCSRPRSQYSFSRQRLECLNRELRSFIHFFVCGEPTEAEAN